MRYIGIDIGASFIKAALLDTEQKSISRICKETISSHVPNINLNLKELDPDTIWIQIQQILQKVKGHDEVDGVLISNQMHGFIILDENGKPRTRYVTWQDQRGSDVATVTQVNDALGVDGQRKTGMPLLMGLPSLNLFQMCHKDGVKEGYFLSLGDYICYRLCGNLAVHPSNCAGSGLMDLEQGTWNHQAIDKMGCSGFQFPRLSEDYQPIGTCSKLNNAKVFPAIGDQQAALLGSMLNDGELSLNVGTGSQVSMIIHNLTFGNYQTRPFFSGEYLKTVTHIPAGRALNVLMGFSQELLRRISGRELDPDEFWTAYQKIDYTEGDLNVDLSFFSGSATGNKGSIDNINESNFSMQTVLAAAYRWMALNYCIHSKRVGSENATRVVVSGGLLAKNDALRRAVHDNFRPLPIIQRFTEDTLVGLYIIALTHDMGYVDFRQTYKKIQDDGLRF